jgi:5-methylcytosine-specific restriction protein A
MRMLKPRLATADLRRLKPPQMTRLYEFYGSAAWKRLLREIIAERGRVCESPWCETPDRGRGGKIIGDHVTELRDGGAPLDRQNVMLLCDSCHKRKTHQVKIERGEGV